MTQKHRAAIEAMNAAAEHRCDRCEGKGWYFRVPDGFNPFLAGGFNTAKAMYRVTCRCARSNSTGGSEDE